MTKRLALLCMLLAVAGSTAAFASDDKSCDDVSKYEEIDREDLQEKLTSKEVFVIDVNSKESFKKAKIPTAIHFETNKKKLAKVLPKDKNMLIVAYCGGEKCTAWQKAAVEACKLGYSNIRHFKPGIKGWKQS